MSYFAGKVNEQGLIIVISTLYRLRKLRISEHEVILRKKMWRYRNLFLRRFVPEKIDFDDLPSIPEPNKSKM